MLIDDVEPPSLQTNVRLIRRRGPCPCPAPSILRTRGNVVLAAPCTGRVAASSLPRQPRARMPRQTRMMPCDVDVSELQVAWPAGGFRPNSPAQRPAWRESESPRIPIIATGSRRDIRRGEYVHRDPHCSSCTCRPAVRVGRAAGDHDAPASHGAALAAPPGPRLPVTSSHSVPGPAWY